MYTSSSYWVSRLTLNSIAEVHAALAAALYADKHAPLLAENQFTIATLLDPHYTDLSYVKNTKHWPPSLVSSLQHFITLSWGGLYNIHHGCKYMKQNMFKFLRKIVRFLFKWNMSLALYITREVHLIKCLFVLVQGCSFLFCNKLQIFCIYSRITMAMVLERDRTPEAWHSW